MALCKRDAIFKTRTSCLQLLFEEEGVVESGSGDRWRKGAW